MTEPRFEQCTWCGRRNCGDEGHGNFFYFYIGIFLFFLLSSFWSGSIVVFWLNYSMVLVLLWKRVEGYRLRGLRREERSFRSRMKRRSHRV